MAVVTFIEVAGDNPIKGHGRFGPQQTGCEQCLPVVLVLNYELLPSSCGPVLKLFPSWECDG